MSILDNPADEAVVREAIAEAADDLDREQIEAVADLLPHELALAFLSTNAGSLERAYLSMAIKTIALAQICCRRLH